jgi:hypothetical protein
VFLDGVGYGGGGGGGASGNGGSYMTGGVGYSGGGDGGTGNPSDTGKAAKPNTGGGGGGGGNYQSGQGPTAGGAGGSGIVIIYCSNVTAVTYANYLMTTFYANTGNIPDSSGPTDQGGNGAYWGSIIQTAQALNPIAFGNNLGVNINGNGNYSCITTGYVYSASAGTIQFQGITDDGLIVNFNSTNVIYQYQRQGSTTYYSSTVTLPAGYTPIRITWYDSGGGGDYRIYFSINGGSFINDGTGVFYH